MHTIVYLSWIRGRQVYVITLQCNLCDEPSPWYQYTMPAMNSFLEQSLSFIGEEIQ